MIRYGWMIAIILSLPLLGSAAIYKSVDKNGNLVFSDQPGGNATEVDLAPVQTYQQANPATKTNKQKPDSKSEEKAKKITEYTNLEITSPTNNSTFWVGGEEITVTATLTPSLQAGDEAVLLYDGQAQSPISGPATALNFNFTDYSVPGKHSLAVEVHQAGPNGKVLKTSNSVAIYVLMHRNNQNTQ